ncbi:TPA: hypothetical protein I9Z29_000903 [Clostridium perfringens]|nr:hypothetical protein [Clostridium perfringens]
MSLKNSEGVQQRIISRDENIENYKKFEFTFGIISDKLNMINNINEAKKDLEELKNYNYNNFNSEELYLQRYEENITRMIDAVQGSTCDVNKVMLHYQALTECKDICNMFKGDSNE